MLAEHKTVLSSMYDRIASALSGACLLGLLISTFSNVSSNSNPMARTNGDEIARAPHAGNAFGTPRSEKPITETHFRETCDWIADMQSYAVRRGIAFDGVGAMIETPHWNYDWLLFEVDVYAGDEVFTLYEAVNKTDPGVRYLTMWNTSEGAARQWELVLD